MILTLLILLLVMAGLFKLTGFIFHIVGKVLGGVLSIVGWLILAAIAVTFMGLALYIIPVIIIIGIIALAVAAASSS